MVGFGEEVVGRVGRRGEGRRRGAEEVAGAVVGGRQADSLSL